MVKKIYAMASLSALSGMVSAASTTGCSNEENKAAATADASASPSATQDTKPASKPDAGEDVDQEQSCLATEAIDATRFPYSRAKRSAGACTTKELDAMSAFFGDKARKGEDVVISDWAKTVGDSCAKCVFSEKTASEWGPVLVKDNKLDNVNRGGCIEIASGKEACGKAYQRVAECRLEACSQSCTTADEFTSCLSDIEKIFVGPCKGAYDTLEKECGTDGLAKYETACRGASFTFEGPVRVQCIAGSASN
jgi:hypothetical protein